jgi:DNA polymerase-3 subunit epsilon
MFSKNLAFVDVETTGGRATRDRITEIAIITVREGEPDTEWSVLVNPQRHIPAHIQRLTGITNDMVDTQPTFADIYQEVYEHLADCIFVAHNARFDYGFIKNEFKRCDVTFRAPVLCTVKLSRKLFPRYRRHNLDSIMQRFNIACEARHRALSDARVLYDFLDTLERRHDTDEVESAIKQQLRRPSLPANICEQDIDNLPESAGVYLFYDQDNMPLYIGKSINLKERVLSHFSSDHSSAKEMKISQNIASIEHIQTCGELGALIKESLLIKEKLPRFNYRLRRYDKLTTIECSEQIDVPSIITSEALDASKIHQHFGLFRTRKAAKDSLLNLAKKHQLCLKQLGLESGSGACFAYQLKQCKGACVGNEDAAQHHLRLLTALQPIRNKTWPYSGKIGIREHSQDRQQTDIHVFDNWCYLGTANDLSDMESLAVDSDLNVSFDLDTYKILIAYLKKNNRADIVDLGSSTQTEMHYV